MVLAEAVALLEEVDQMGLMEAISKAKFADVKRPIEGGKGLDGVVPKGPRYTNPLRDRMLARGRANNSGPRSVLRG